MDEQGRQIAPQMLDLILPPTGTEMLSEVCICCHIMLNLLEMSKNVISQPSSDR